MFTSTTNSYRLSHQALTHLLTLSVQKIRGQSSLGNGTTVLLLDVSFVVGLERLLELDLLRVSLGVVELSLETEEMLSVLGVLVRHSSLTLSPD